MTHAGDTRRRGGQTTSVTAGASSVSRASRPPGAIKRVQRDSIVVAVLKGVPPETAAVANGVPRRTHQGWLHKGRQDGAREPYRSYARRIDEAVEEWHASLVVEINASDDPRDKQWLLSRRFPGLYTERRRVEGEVALRPLPMIDPSKGSIERLRLLRELLEEFAPDNGDPALSETARPALELLETNG